MFLYENTGRKDKVHINEVTKEAKALHYRGDNEQAIEKFIVDVIKGVDPMKEQREEFFSEHLPQRVDNLHAKILLMPFWTIGNVD